jgi:predicted Fe-S protein YdhL (DUF1289 family)
LSAGSAPGRLAACIPAAVDPSFSVFTVMSAPLRSKPAPVVPSPCVDVCQLDPRTGWCEGCFRTLDEIAAWGALDNAQKRTVWKQLPQRRAAVAAERLKGQR